MIIPPPKYEEPEVPELSDAEWIRAYLNCVPWKCDKCGLTNFGRNEKCADCREKKP